jgi:hypothetical protein
MRRSQALSYANLSLDEKQLTRTASTFSTRRGVFLKKKVNVRTNDDFTKSVDARVNYMFPENEEMKARLTMLFDRNIKGGQTMNCSV